jgi:septal ring factor EnvC (AmiA/AmiB activator)
MVLVLLGFWRYQSRSSKLEAAEAQVKRLQADTAAMGARLSQWRAVTRRQSDSVQALRRQAKRLGRRLDRARQTAAAARRRAARQAEAVAIPDSIQRCIPAVRWAARHADSLATDW